MNIYEKHSLAMLKNFLKQAKKDIEKDNMVASIEELIIRLEDTNDSK